MMWIVFTYTDSGVTEIFEDEHDAVSYYEDLKDAEKEDADLGVQPGDVIFIAKVQKKASWQEDKEQPIYAIDEDGHETEEESGEYYYSLKDVEVSQ